MEKSNKKIQNLFRAIRWLFLFLILVFVTSIGLMHQYLQKPKLLSTDAFCPFGGIESFFSSVVYGVMLKRIMLSSFILLIAVLIAAVIFRRAFCGQICVLGTIQEFFAKIGQFIFKKRLNMPKMVDKPLRYLKYLVLLVIVVWQITAVYQAVKAGNTNEIPLVIRPYDPWAAYMHLASADLFAEFTIGFIVLIVVLIGSVLYDRFFCKYLCPMGATLGLINRIGLFKVTRNDKTCIHCKACNKVCPVNIDVMSVEIVNSSECINCNECVNKCPVPDTLYVEGPKKIKASPLAVTLITLLIFGLVLGITTVSGQFQWFQQSLEKEVEKLGTFDASLIKGSQTFKEVSDVSKVPKEAIIEKFKITEEEFNSPIKEIKDKYDFETEEVREFIKEYLESKKL
ncbi:MAG: 4Fe-4S binding protein [Spirochaetes bacterium]|nr:4Fe-4S binding protein [Spirochaetota bacterium]